MVLSNPFPGHTALTTFADLRRDLEGLVVRNAAGVMRAGVFPDHLNALVTGRSDMKVNIGDFRAVQNRGGAVLIANVGTDTSVTLPAAPAANKRIDLVYVTMRSTTLADAASTPVFGFVQGTASATPVAPSLPANLSTAIPLATVEIPAGATTTLSAGVVITQVYPYTVLAGGVVVVRNTVELAAWTPADGARAYNLADSSDYVRAGGVWEPVSLYLYADKLGNSSPPTTANADLGTITGGAALSLSVTVPRARQVIITLTGNYLGTSDSYFGVNASGATVRTEINSPNSRVAFFSATNAHMHLEVPLLLNAGTTLLTFAGKATGGGGTRTIYDPSLTVRGV